MSDAIHWILELDIKEGAFEAFKDLMNEMVEATKANEPGALIYEWFVSDDARHCHIAERYADSDAVMTHLASFGEKFADRFLAILQPTRFVVYGNADSQVRQALAGFGAVHMEQIGGFAR